MILVGLDLGEKRIGVSVSDQEGLFVHPRPAIICPKGEQHKRLTDLMLVERPGEIVIGHPIELDGRRGERAIWVEKFCSRLKGQFSAFKELRGVKLTLWDERLSSIQAERALREAGHSSERIKTMTDSMAATIILESYINSRRIAVK